MNTDKIIEKLVKKAEEVEEIDIPEELVTAVPLEDFNNTPKTKIYFKEGIFYRKAQETGSEWLKTSLKPEIPVSKPLPQPVTAPKIIDNTEARLKALESWTWSFKSFIEAEIKRLEAKQDEITGVLKEYIDNKFKEKI